MKRKKTIAVVFGTRPDAIKSAPVLKALARERNAFSVVPIATAQHREMLDQVLKSFGIRPRYDLNIMRTRQSLAQITARALRPLDALLSAVEPDMVLVQGDTTTTFTAALAAFYRRIPVGHIEAGLRTDDVGNPFPEEMNRRLTSSIAALHFAPTQTARTALVREGVDAKKIFITGNTVIDALRATVRPAYRFSEPRLRPLVRSGKKIILATMHRRENWGAPMRAAACALRRLALESPETAFVLPMHRNPEVRSLLRLELNGVKNILLCEPLAYADFVNLMAASFFIITDSGGIQEEAPSLGKPVLVLRTVTERPEAVAAGCVRLVGLDEAAIVSAARELLDSGDAYRAMSTGVNPYGDGCASARIVQIILHYFGLSESLPAEFAAS
ncbi:MAG: non-hydrolyzing UDP-N-acetylglucosamine 2-epimerase [Acidobacteriota bacterium]